MTETQWIVGTNAAKMLDYLTREMAPDVDGGAGGTIARHYPLISYRKLRLAACAITHIVLEEIESPHKQRVLEVAEKYADNDEYKEELRELWHHGSGEPFSLLSLTAHVNPLAFSWPTSQICGGNVYGPCPDSACQAMILRHIVGNPFNQVLADCESSSKSNGVCWHHNEDLIRVRDDLWLCPKGLKYFNEFHKTFDVISSAQALYNGEDCAFAVHDALAQAGAIPELIHHFRWCANKCCDGKKSVAHNWHPKGCWALDKILGKK